MSSSPSLFLSGLRVIAAVVTLMLLASVLTVIASTILLWRYRRAVARLMAAQGETAHRNGGLAPAGLDSSAAPESSPIVPSDAAALRREATAADPLYRLAYLQPWRHSLEYAVPGALFALLMGFSAFFAFSQTEFTFLRAAVHPLQFLFMFWTFVWPAVLTINIVAAPGSRKQCAIVLCYLAVLALLSGFLILIPTESPLQVGNVMVAAWSGETPTRLASKWTLFNLAPTLLLVVFRSRRVRAVAPLVLSFMTVLSAGLLTLITAAFLYQDLSVAVIAFAAETFKVRVVTALAGYFLLLAAVACILSGLIGWSLLLWIRKGYRRKAVSDQSLAIDTVWLVFGLFYAQILAFAGPGWLLSLLPAFFFFKIAASVTNKQAPLRKHSHRFEPALLVLRVFAIGKPSEILFDEITKRWRYIGNVRLIAGTDLAFSTVAPHQFLAFVSGKLSQLFIRDGTAVDRGLAEMDTWRDRDGRFRLNDFFCHADTWQSVLVRLVRSTDVVLMDLRSFSATSSGCVFEIKELLNTVPLPRLVFVVDGTTDNAFLRKTVEETLGELRPESPNLGAAWAAFQSFGLNSVGHGELQALLRRLCGAAAWTA